MFTCSFVLRCLHYTFCVLGHILFSKLDTFYEQIKLRDVPNELLYGKVGYLWACAFLNKHIGEDTIPSTYTVSSVF